MTVRNTRLYSQIEIQLAYSNLCKKFDGIERQMTLSTTPDNNGGDHLELHPDGTMALVWTERGRETTRLETQDVNELLYWLVKDIAEGRGYELEMKTRPEDFKGDTRRRWFPLAIAEMSKVSETWADRLSQEFDETLSRSPYWD